MRRALAAVLLTLSSAAHAFVPESDGALIVEHGAQPRRTRAVDADRLGAWTAERDRDTGVITRMWGTYVDAPGATSDAAIAERTGRAFLAQHLAELAPGARIADFAL